MIRLRIPEGFPPARGEQSFADWLNNNYPRLATETELERLCRLFPKTSPDEPFLTWAGHLANHEVFCHALTTWPHQDSRIKSVKLTPEGWMLVDYDGHDELLNFWKVFGRFMDKRMEHAVRMGLVPPQYLVARGRYGIGFMEKNIFHDMLRYIGIVASFCIDTRGQSFFMTNSAMPSTDSQQIASEVEIYRPKLRKIWSMLVSSSTNNAGTGMALMTHTLNRSPAPTGDQVTSKVKWQHYNALVSAQILRPGRMVIRGFISPEVFMLCGFYPMVGEDQLAAAGFENGVPPSLEKYPGVLRGQCEDRQHGESSTDPRSRVTDARQIFMTWNQLVPIRSLLTMLEGCDLTKIKP